MLLDTFLGSSGRSVNKPVVNSSILVLYCSMELHNVELNDLYPSPNIVLVIKSRRMKWVGHVARMGEERVCV